ncbi:MAG: SseB family protein [Sulfuricellaceae bacterium]
MNDEMFEPKNELERQLADLHEGLMAEDDFLAGLASAQVFMPVQDDEMKMGIQSSNQAKPLVVAAEDGTPVLLVFSSPERAKPVTQEFEGFGGGLLTEFTWVLERIEGGAGISINPGWELGYDIEPLRVLQLSRSLRSAS